MSNYLDTFCMIPCLSEKTKIFPGIDLQKKWFPRTDKRVIGHYLQKFIAYNSSFFEFLGVQPVLMGSDLNSKIYFRTSQFVGVIPLRSPENGKQIGDFIITPRYSGSHRFEESLEILNILGNDLEPEIIESAPLASGNNFRPPMYLEAIKFINSLDNLLKNQWRKFDRKEIISSQPIGQINWKKYIENENAPENKFIFPTGINVLSQLHGEYSQIRFVFDICKNELLSRNTPLRVKLGISNKLALLEEKLYNHKPKHTKQIPIRLSDSPSVQQCKKNANRILSHDYESSTAWRIDFSKVFEKYIQYIFNLITKEIGGALLSNYRFNLQTSNRFNWELKYLEPDAIYYKSPLSVFIDAKYKSHMYNKFDESDYLKNDHRNDLHQIMSYCSFSSKINKYGFLCYPSNQLELKKIVYENKLNLCFNNIFLVGIPLKKEFIKKAKSLLSIELNKLFAETMN